VAQAHPKDRPLGAVVADWSPPLVPDRAPLRGRYAALTPLDADAHAAPLHAAFRDHPELWDYMGYGPFPDAAAYRDWAAPAAGGADPLFFAIAAAPDAPPGGVASYLRIQPAAGAIEIGHICLSPALQGTRTATEALWLMIDRAFALGYRRVEWKCNALNAASRRAAQRLGFSFEGVFRQADVVKGRNRDTAWFSIIDAESPALRDAFVRWLDPGNFEAGGAQRAALSALTRPLLAAVDPARP
jgi:RimJ/RimL family protein N-acetyltransferase